YKRRKSRAEIMKASVDAVRHARGYCQDVEFSPEDASRTDFDYMCDVLSAVIDAGARTINIPDTVGYAIPREWGERIARIREKVQGIDKVVLSVHCHNDLGQAVANSLTALMNGARQGEGTINGSGERAGSAPATPRWKSWSWRCARARTSSGSTHACARRRSSAARGSCPTSPASTSSPTRRWWARTRSPTRRASTRTAC